MGPWASELADAAVVNLAGALVDRRPTAASIEMLTQSRVVPTQTLAAAARQGNTPLVWIQASTLAIYGDAGDAILDESSPPADGPPQMAGVASAWEAASEAVVSHRKVVFRMGLVLDRDTPALQRLTALTRWGLSGRIGSGNQWISWIHISDFLAATRRALIDDALSGVIHVTSPNPVRNVEMMAAMRKVLRRQFALPTPVPLVRLGAMLLRTDAALALSGRRCVPLRLVDQGFDFAYPELMPALQNLVHSSDSA